MRARGAARLALGAAFAASCAACPPPPEAPRVLRRHAAPAARQGVAVTGSAFYAIDTRAIEKYDRETGALLSRWETGGEPGRGPEHSRLVAYDTDWRPLASYRYPDDLIARFAGYGNSGGAVAAGHVLYPTGHDARELYVACLRSTDHSVVVHSTWPAPFAGQGIAWDAGSGTLWAIERRAREVLQLEIPEDHEPARWPCRAGPLP